MTKPRNYARLQDCKKLLLAIDKKHLKPQYKKKNFYNSVGNMPYCMNNLRTPKMDCFLL